MCDARGGRSGIEPDSHLGHGVACISGCRPPLVSEYKTSKISTNQNRLDGADSFRPRGTGETARFCVLAAANAADLAVRCCSKSGGGLPGTSASASSRKGRDRFVGSVAVSPEHGFQRRYSGGVPNPPYTTRTHKAFARRPRTDKIATLALPYHLILKDSV